MFSQVSQCYQQRCVFSDFSFEIPELRLVVSGANGNGKTVLLLLLAGLNKPASGLVSFKR